MSKPVSTPHDALVKLSLKEVAIARDFLRAHLPQRIQVQIDFETLRPSDEEFVSSELKAVQSDIIYQCQIDGQPGYIYTLIEHQSTADELMAFRLLEYQVRLMRSHLQQGYKQLPIIIPLCLYHGRQSPYPHETDIMDCFERRELAEELMFKPFHLIDLTVMSEEAIEAHGLAALFEMLIKHHNTKQVYRLIQEVTRRGIMVRVMSNLKNNDNYLASVLEYLLNTGEDRRHAIEEILALLSETLPEQEETIMTLAEQLKQRGRQEGIQQGIQQGMEQGVKKGRQEGKQEGVYLVAKTMLRSGVSLEKIATYTGLSLTTLRQLEKSL